MFWLGCGADWLCWRVKAWWAFIVAMDTKFCTFQNLPEWFIPFVAACQLFSLCVSMMFSLEEHIGGVIHTKKDCSLSLLGSITLSRSIFFYLPITRFDQSVRILAKASARFIDTRGIRTLIQNFADLLLDFVLTMAGDLGHADPGSDLRSFFIWWILTRQPCQKLMLLLQLVF